MAKVATIKLTYHRLYQSFERGEKPAWVVEAVTDSIEFNPKQILEKDTVDSLCASSAWKVTIVAPKES